MCDIFVVVKDWYMVFVVMIDSIVVVFGCVVLE